jgi:hypothetical protein
MVVHLNLRQGRFCGVVEVDVARINFVSMLHLLIFFLNPLVFRLELLLVCFSLIECAGSALLVLQRASSRSFIVFYVFFLDVLCLPKEFFAHPIEAGYLFDVI